MLFSFLTRDEAVEFMRISVDTVDNKGRKMHESGARHGLMEGVDDVIAIVALCDRGDGWAVQHK